MNDFLPIKILNHAFTNFDFFRPFMKTQFLFFWNFLIVTISPHPNLFFSLLNFFKNFALSFNSKHKVKLRKAIRSFFIPNILTRLRNKQSPFLKLPIQSSFQLLLMHFFYQLLDSLLINTNRPVFIELYRLNRFQSNSIHLFIFIKLPKVRIGNNISHQRSLVGIVLQHLPQQLLQLSIHPGKKLIKSGLFLVRNELCQLHGDLYIHIHSPYVLYRRRPQHLKDFL